MARLFTLQEANGMLSVVEQALDQAQRVTAALRDVRDQLVDLRIIWGDQVTQASCPDHEEYERYQRRFAELERDLSAAATRLTDMGCEVKDLEQGLVDFRAARGEDIVYLCWRKGEHGISFWHRVEDGFQGRQPIDRF